MKSGEIVLLSFPFTDLSGNKVRSALIIASNEKDAIVIFITSKLKWKDKFDVLVLPTPLNGLKTESLFRISKITTLDKNLVLGKLGELGNQELIIIKHSLKKLFKL